MPIAVAPGSPDIPKAVQILPIANEEWNRINDYMAKMGRLTKLDVQALTQYCVLYSAFVTKASELLSKQEYVSREDDDKEMATPFVAQVTEDARGLLEVCRKLGLTARTRGLNKSKQGTIPDEIHALRGNPGKRKLRPDFKETYFAESWGEKEDIPPEWLNEHGAKQWENFRFGFANTGLWTPLDRVPLVTACGVFAIVTDCVRILKESNYETYSYKRSKSYTHPLWNVQQRCFNVLALFWADYAGSPFDREQFEVGEEKKTEEMEIDLDL